MTYANYAIQNDDGSWTGPVSMRSTWNGHRDWHLKTDEEWREHGWYPCVVVNETYNPAIQDRSGPMFTLSDGVVTAEYTVTYNGEKAVAAVNAERDRRLRSGFPFAGHRFDYDEASQRRITGAATLAGFAMGQGAGEGNLRWADADSNFEWISQDNDVVPMDAPTCFAFGQAAAAWDKGHVFAARALKDEEDGVPGDYASDEHWPAGR